MSQIANANLTTIWHQEWLTGRELGPREDDSVIRERYIGKLRTSFVRLKDEEDTLVWSLNPSGDYTPKRVKRHLRSKGMWSRSIGGGRRFGGYPSKSRIFVWLLLNNKALTWDILQKRNTQGAQWEFGWLEHGEGV